MFKLLMLLILIADEVIAAIDPSKIEIFQRYVRSRFIHIHTQVGFLLEKESCVTYVATAPGVKVIVLLPLVDVTGLFNLSPFIMTLNVEK